MWSDVGFHHFIDRIRGHNEKGVVTLIVTEGIGDSDIMCRLIEMC